MRQLFVTIMSKLFIWGDGLLELFRSFKFHAIDVVKMEFWKLFTQKLFKY